MSLSKDDSFERTNLACPTKMFKKRRKLIMAGLIALNSSVGYSKDKESASSQNLCHANRNFLKAKKTVKARVNEGKNKEHFICQECLVKRAVQRSAFINKGM